ncbi:hypothetical protein HZB04_00675 [Candidatus Wolfebacteria bacterium]|nr:hypothetical protein [Candidatus Wolfebacteria bacterium]
MAKSKHKDDITPKLDVIIELLQHILAVQLYKNGVPQEIIGGKLGVAKATVVKMVRGVRKEKNYGK